MTFQDPSDCPSQICKGQSLVRGPTKLPSNAAFPTLRIMSDTEEPTPREGTVPTAADGANTVSVDAVAARVLDTLLSSATALQAVSQTPTGPDPGTQASNTTSLPPSSSGNTDAGPCEYLFDIFIIMCCGPQTRVACYSSYASGGTPVHSPASPERSPPVGRMGRARSASGVPQG